ncbi:MAG: amino acid adenylation domain-containing protein [Xenococcaceae cyanobacterium MO_188.B29]|nr:amino acid adenylation domain-containing protein [Xenococcaceae cyanobacterium MO_188.B29]
MNAKLVDSKTLNKITESELRKVLVAYLQEQIAKLVGIEPSDVEEQQPLQYLGIDSLIAVKLRNRLRTDLSVDISAVKFMADANLTDLVVVVSQLLNESLGKISVSNARQKDEYSEPKSYPLTYGQQGLWFLYKLAPESAAYNLAFTARICSFLSIPALQRAIQKLVTRHLTLRTVFKQQGGEPFQEVCQDWEVEIKQIDASSWNWDELRKNAIAAHREPFDLERGPLLRVNLFTRSEKDQFLLLGIHHIVIDGFSFGILLDELRLLYQSESTGQAVSLPPIKRQYSRFVQWQKEMLESPIGETHRNYWHQKLSGELPVLKLPVDRWRSPVDKYQRGYYDFELDGQLTEQLKAMVKTEGATLYMILLAAFQVLLHRYTGQEDIIVGSPSEGRNQSELAGTIGFFINMIALRVKITSELTFSELLSQVRQTVLEALTHQDYPSALLIESLQLNKDATLAGLFQVVFNLLKLSDMGADYELSMSTKAKRREDWGRLSLEPFVIPQQEGQYDEGQYNLGLDIVETNESIYGIFRYDADLFDAATIRRMAEHFKNLLAAIVTNSNQAIGLLPMLGQAEKQQLEAWNENPQDFDFSCCIHQLFEAQVERTPNAVAVLFEGSTLTYRELNHRANQLARYLQDLGVKPEVLVGICLDRSLEMIVSLLGVLKAGGVYLPLDPAYPQERLSFILSDAQVSVLLTQSKLVEELPKQKAAIVLLDREREAIALHSETNLAVQTTPDNLAYIVYTSGSTGQPKGVQVLHRNLVNAYQGWENSYNLRTLKSHLQMASFSFDVFSGDWVRALCSGAKLVLCPRDLLLEPEQLYQLMCDEEIDSAEFVPAVLKNLVQYLEREQQNLHFIKLLVVGSDILYVREFEQFRRVCGEKTRLINSYGVTEATIDSTYFESTTLELSSEGAIPIGRPFGNTQIYILDNQLQPVAIGAPGELHLGGLGLSRGYLNRPDLTEQKFISNPFAPEQKLYKTGDIARYLPDGNIEFLARIDNQVKVRGFRIEVGEIEAVLLSQSQVKEAVVIAREERAGNKYLVAYIVTESQTLNARTLKDFLQPKLPDYMLPSVFVLLEAFPLTPNGKIDRHALPVPNLAKDHKETFVAPRTPTEVAIAEIMASVLGLQQIGIYDNFFELGGHSLLATQVISRLRQTFNLDFPLRPLLEAPTVEALDKTLWKLRQGNSHRIGDSFLPLPKIISNCLVPIQIEGTQPPLFCIHPAGGQIIAYKNIANCMGSDRPIYGLQSRALDNPTQEHSSIEEIATEYTKAISQERAEGPYYLMGWSMGGVIALSIAKQLEKQQQKVAFVGLVDAFLIAENFPTLKEGEPYLEFLPLLGSDFMEALMNFDESEQQVLRNSLVNLSSGDRLKKVLAWGQKRNILPHNISDEILQKQLALTEIHKKLLSNHHPPKTQTKLHIWWALDRLGLNIAHTDWEEYTTGGSYTKALPGNHFSIFSPTYVEMLAQDLQASLEAVQSSGK